MTVDAGLFRRREEDEYWFDEGCYILELLNDPADPAVSVVRARVAPGQTTRWHRLRDTVERYLVQEGRGEVGLGDAPVHRVGPGDVVLIPPMTPQRIHNPGPGDLVFLAICSPRFTPACYEDLEGS